MQTPVGFEKEELESALEAAGTGVWRWEIVADRVVWSEETAKIFGIKLADFSGTREEFLGLVHPDDLSEVAKQIEAALRAPGEPYLCHHRVCRPDGTLCWVEGTGRFYANPDGTPSHMVGTVRDVTHRTRAEARYRVFTAMSSDVVYAVDLEAPRGAVTLIAGSFEEVLGYSPKEISSLEKWLEIVHPEDRSKLENLIGDIARGEPFSREYRVLAKDGAVRWLRSRVVPIRDPLSGAMTQYMASIQNVSETKFLEEQLLKARKLEALALIAGGVAHEFNNLLTVIHGGLEETEALLSAASPEERLGLFDARSATERAAELTRGLLTFARKKSGKRQTVSLSEVIRTAERSLRLGLSGDAELVVRVAPEPLHVEIDVEALEALLRNLLGNARDAMGGRGRIRLGLASLRIESIATQRPGDLPAGDYAHLTVSDSGAGISEEVRGRIFDPFFTTKSVGRGTGLGLAISYGTVRQAGGAIEVESVEGSGTTFHVYLPLIPSGQRNDVAPRPASAPRNVAATILVVEDEMMVRRMVRRVLEDRGFLVIEADSAQTALGLPPERLKEVDLVLSDVRMPGMDGLEFAEQFLAERPGVPFVLMSGFVDEDRLERATTDPRWTFLQKPFSSDALVSHLEEKFAAI